MKVNVKLISLSLCLLLASAAQSQVLISLIFGKALNTPKMEFGLVGGFNRSYILTLDEAEPLNNFNIGFYFHIQLKNNSFLSTGVLVKSEVGASGLPTYPVGNASVDSIYSVGKLTKKIHYFYVPIMFQQRFNQERWYVEGGFQLGLRNKASDIFDEEVLNGDLKYTLDARDQYSRLDAGLIGGVGYKFKKERKSMAVGVNYYYGLVDVAIGDDVIKNSALYVYMKIPIGATPKQPKEPKQ